MELDQEATDCADVKGSSELHQTELNLRWITITFFGVFAANVLCSVYASIEARGLYADAAALLVVLYEGKSFFLNGLRLRSFVRRLLSFS